MTDNTATATSQTQDVSRLLARFTMTAVFVLLALTVIALVQLMRLGLSEHYLLLLCGAVLSAAALIAYSRMLVKELGMPRKSMAGSLAALGGFIPYVFGCYLVFYEGFWRLHLLADGFSVSLILGALIYVVAGYAVVSAIYRVSELGRSLGKRAMGA